MPRKWPGLVLVVVPMLALSNVTLAQKTNQQPMNSPEQDRAAVNMDDVVSMNGIIKTLYDVISGPGGQKRDWDRFRSLFVSGAHLIPTVPTSTGTMGTQVLSPEDYIQRYQQALEKNGFFEREVARRTEQFAHIAQVFSTYESRHQPQERPFARGINSIQLVNDGHRWWIVNILWEAEQPGRELPKKYLGFQN